VTGQAILADLQTHSLLWLFLLAIFEGPIVTVGAGWLARLGDVSLLPAFGVLVMADLVGDLGLYSIGRSGLDWVPMRIRRWFKITDDNVHHVVRHFHHKGGRTLVIGKLTHSLGFAVLVAAGVGRMKLPAFLWYNLVGTVPKTGFFLGLGFLLGHAFGAIEFWLWRASVVILALGVAAVLGWIAYHRGERE